MIVYMYRNVFILRYSKVFHVKYLHNLEYILKIY